MSDEESNKMAEALEAEDTAQLKEIPEMEKKFPQMFAEKDRDSVELNEIRRQHIDVKKELSATQTFMYSLAAKRHAKKWVIDALSHRCSDLEMKRANAFEAMLESSRLMQEHKSKVSDAAKACGEQALQPRNKELKNGSYELERSIDGVEVDILDMENRIQSIKDEAPQTEIRVNFKKQLSDENAQLQQRIAVVMAQKDKLNNETQTLHTEHDCFEMDLNDVCEELIRLSELK